MCYWLMAPIIILNYIFILAVLYKTEDKVKLTPYVNDMQSLCCMFVNLWRVIGSFE